MSEILTLYPYAPGNYGIPNEAFFPVNPQPKGITSGSGRELLIWNKGTEIGIRDPELTDPKRRPLRLIANVDNEGFFHADIWTKHPSFKSGRHPDLWGTKFIEFALTTLEKQNGEIKGIKASWWGDSDNYALFQEGRSASDNDLQEAVRATLSWRIYSKHGFTRIPNNCIQIVNNYRRSDSLVSVVFLKESTTPTP